ncbi:MAG: hypothetical protein ABI399_11870 [Bauldia sp.]
MRQFLVLAFALASGPTLAMEFTATDRGINTVIEASGEVTAGDDQRLRDVAASVAANIKAMTQSADAFRTRTVLELDSPGGNLGAGLQLGYAIRELGLATRVPDGKSCASACTYAFLGGLDRRVAGPFGIHAMSTSEEKIEAGMLDDVQEISAILLAYAREMAGKSDMAEVALKVKASTIYEVPDDQLRDWNIITHITRPAQYFVALSGPLSKCGDTAWREEAIPHDVICADLTVARAYRDIEDAIFALKAQPGFDGAAMDAEQARWEKYWLACETAPLGKLTRAQQIRPAIEACMDEAFAARSGELASLAEFYRISNSEPAKTGWKTQK